MLSFAGAGACNSYMNPVELVVPDETLVKRQLLLDHIHNVTIVVRHDIPRSVPDDMLLTLFALVVRALPQARHVLGRFTQPTSRRSRRNDAIQLLVFCRSGAQRRICSGSRQ